MVPKLHAKGSSFKGAAAYVLHDKGQADSADRVGFTATRNLAVDDPDMAWRIMAATAMDQPRLKAEAGVKNTGRKSHKHVLHLTLNWHPDQKPTQEEMLEAADGALRALGAEKHQALIVMHNDEAHDHLHIVCNRVSPEDGRHLSSSKEKLKLSQWAQAYEEKTGIVCENRVLNNQMRDRGEFVRGQKDKARHIFEAQRTNIANDNDQARGVLDNQRAKDHALSLKGRNLAKIHAGQWDKMETAHKARKASLVRALARKREKARVAVIERMRPSWIDLNKRQAKEQETFASMESSFFGRAGNILKTARLSTSMVDDEETNVIKRTFGIVTNAGKRKVAFEKFQERARIALQRRQDQKVLEAAKALKASHAQKLADTRQHFLKEREELAQVHLAQQGQLKQAWAVRNRQRKAALEELGRSQNAAHQLLQEYRGAAQKPMSRRQAGDVLSKYQKLYGDAVRPKAHEQDNDRSDDYDDS